MFRLVAFLALVGLAVYALADCAGSDENERGGAPKGLWFVIIVVLPLFGPLAWIITRRSRTPRVAGAGPATRPGRPQRKGPVAPDDDPDFLWRLEQDRRRRERESGRATGTDDPDTDATGTDASSSPDDDAPQK